MSSSPPARKKQNAASQFRARRGGGGGRVSHPLLDSPSTPPRKSSSSSNGSGIIGNNMTNNPVLTPERPALLNALEMAARPSKKGTKENILSGSAVAGGDGGASANADAPTSYISSLEAMAAHVEASHSTRRNNNKKLQQSHSSHPGSPKLLRKRSSNNGNGSSLSSSSLSSSSSSRGKRKSSSSYNAKSQPPVKKMRPPLGKVWLIAIPILLSFLIFESFLWLLVFRFNDHDLATGEGLLGIQKVGTTHQEVVVDITTRTDDDNNAAAADPVAEEDNMAVEEEVEEIIADNEEKEREANDAIAAEKVDLSSSVAEEKFEGEKEEVKENRESEDVDVGNPEDNAPIIETQSRESDHVAEEEEPTEETETDESSTGDDDLTILQSMLEEGFAKLRVGSSAESQDDEGQSNRALAESLCGKVWVAVNEMLSSESSMSDETAGSQTDNVSSYESLALHSQYCLGGAGLAFLTKDSVDSERLGVSTKVFDRLSRVEPHNADVRAGLGTSLLMQGIFNDNSGAIWGGDDYQRSLLTMAAHHLNSASSLCSTTSNPLTAGGGDEMDTVSISMLSMVGNDATATLAAVLHNLAIAYIALGDNKNSIPILLRAAALRRKQSNDTKLYWNAPHEVLQLAEEKAMLIAAKTKKPEKAQKKEKRVPFFR